MEKLIQLQNELAQQITRCLSNYKKSKSRITQAYIETRIELLKSYWSSYTTNHLEILKLCTDEHKKSLSYFTEDKYYTTEDVYLEFKTLMRENLHSCTTTKHTVHVDDTSSTNVTSVIKTSLPPIMISSFSGNYKDWQSFYDLFKSLIHENTSLSKIQKYHYLKCNLKGDAEALIRQFPLTEASYDSALELLVSRYDNKRVIVNSIISRLLNQKKLTSEHAKGMCDLLDTTNECISALTNLNISTDTWDAIITHIIINKFDHESHRLWEQQLGATREVPTWKELSQFMEMRFRSIEAYNYSKPKESTQRTLQTIKIHKTTSEPLCCAYCSQDHYIHNCKEFGKLSVEERRDYAQDNQLCFNCLIPKHMVRFCKQNSSCRICKRRHHSLLHLISSTKTESTSTDNNDKSEETSVVTHKAEISVHNNQVSQVLLPTAQVIVMSSNGLKHKLRAMIDQGSQASFISFGAAEKLGLKRVQVYSKVTGVDPSMSSTSKGMVEFNLFSHQNVKLITKVNAHVMKTLSSILPRKEFALSTSLNTKELILADPNFNKPGCIDIILGADVYPQIMLEGLKKIDNTIAQNSQLGWIISGNIEGQEEKQYNEVILMHCQIEVDNLLRKFWESEELFTEKRLMSEKEIQCEKMYDKTHSRTSTGRYIVALPFSSENVTPFGESRHLSVKRLTQMEKRFLKDSIFHERYVAFMDDYLETGHMEKVPIDDLQKSNVCYLPHHGVLRESSTTTKLRTVFDGSAQTSTGVSLNDKLLVGPPLQQDIRDLFLRWRTYKICLVADIKQMYRQILVREEDRDFQRIVWRSDTKSEIVDYRLCTVTYGTSCAPYLAIKTLIQVAVDESESFPQAARVVQSDFYMDDLLSGCETEQEAIELCKEVKQLLAKGGFVLHKWSSNSLNVLKACTTEDNQLQKTVNIEMENSIKALGIKWNPNSDNFELSIDAPINQSKITKRSILSDIAKIYDPLGWLSPVVVVAKMFLQKLWLLGLDWDDELPVNLKTEWLTFCQEIKHMNVLILPRWIGVSKTNKLVEIHGFSDASTTAYAGVVYVRILNEDSSVTVKMVTAKTKVAPVKQITLPRLELCGAVLTAKLIQRVRNCLDVSDDNIYAWTDSTIVLAWLQKHPNVWKTFVGNRVTEILNVTRARQWRHVSTKENPADCASRGISASQLAQQELWWNGPEWLSSPNSVYEINENIPETIVESKILVHNVICDEVDNELTFKRLSTLVRLTRVISYCFRFVNLCKQKIQSKLMNLPKADLPKYLSTDELKNTLQCCIKLSQKYYYSNEIDELSNNHKVNKKSSLFSLHPFIDKNGILRVGGRLKNAPIPHDTKYPIVLSGKSYLASLIVDQTHKRTLHGGPLLMLNVIRCNYWITNVKSIVKLHVKRCVKCVRQSPQFATQLMGNLPSARVTVSKPFSNSGVDFAGPVMLKSSKLRKPIIVKAYIAVFICLATKALHLELVSELSTNAFIAAFKRFVSCRGQCSHLYSDCGTNFIGANFELVKIINKTKAALPNELSELLASDGTTWHLIPPGSPTFGGVWEAGVRSIKKHIRRVIADTKLTFEEYSTLLAQIECCLNSRPISALNDSPDDLTALTPGHFLVFSPPVVVLNENLIDVPMSRLHRWQHIEHILQSFWQRWQQEYLVTLQHRYKWGSVQPSIKLNDLVIIKDERVPPSKWLLGRVVNLHPGNDGLIRVVTVRCKNTVLKRPITKLCLLPVNAK